MAGLLTDLLQTSQSLDAQQLALQVTGNNLANVNNPHYARQSVVMGTTGIDETSIGEISMGVVATGIQQSRDPFLDAQVTQEIAQTGTLQAQLDQLQQAQANLGEQVTSADTNTSITSTSQSTTGISSALANFFTAASQLSSNPNETSAKQSLFQSAQTLASTINTADANLSGMQGNISNQITQDTVTVNSLLQNIATLNGQIQQMNVQKPASANDLVDQRQADLEQLAGYMNFTTTIIPNGNGQIQVNALDPNSNPVNLVDKTTVAGTINFTGTSFTVGSPATTLGFTGGSLVGDLTASTGAIQTLRNQLATTASQLTTAVNTAYNPTNATGNFFQSTPAAGQLLTLDPTLSADSMKTTDTANAGANELALAVAQVGTHNFSTTGGDQINGSITGYYSQAVTAIGQSIDGVTSQLTDQTTVQSMIQTQRDSVSGVNENEELTNLLTYQRAFQAQARMMNTINDCLDIVVNGLFGASVS